MIPDDRARKYHERLAEQGAFDTDGYWRPVLQETPLNVALLTANSLRNLARKIDRDFPRNDGIADSVRALAADLTDFSLREPS